MNKIKNAFYAQSGGVTAVINASAAGVITKARQHPDKIGKVYAGKNGIIGALREELIDTSLESNEDIAALKHTPAGAFGSCRYKLNSIKENRTQYERLIEVFETHNIGYFFYNGGGDSQDTAHKVSQLSEKMGYPITCIGIPKTVDNDLPVTDNSPGFGSVAKYVAVSIMEAGMDVASMAESSTKVFVLEVMGRHAGWIAASGGLAAQTKGQAPQIILFPEIPFNREKFLAKVNDTIQQYGFCAIVASEGIRDETGKFVGEAGGKDAFGHSQLGGAAARVVEMIKDELGLKSHYAIADYLQRSARHIASQMDVDQAFALGEAAVEAALAGKQAVMMTIERISNKPYQWKIGEAPLEVVANVEQKIPRRYITEDGFFITDPCREYLSPLIQGEAFPPFNNGLPQYQRLKNQLVEKKLSIFKV